MESYELSILESFDRMQHSLQQLSRQLLQESPRCWLPVSDSEQMFDPLKRAEALYSDIWYRDGLDGRETRSLWGLIGGSEVLIQRARTANIEKDLFRQAVKAYKLQTGKLPDKLLHKRAEHLAEKLNRSGLARLHLKQCYRHIPLLEHTPDKVGFSWYSSGRSIRRISIEQAEKMLLRLDESQPHIQLQLRKLGDLKPGESLAQLQTQAPVMRANVRWKCGDTIVRKARNCPLPLLFPLAEGQPFPEHNEPAINPPEQRQRIERNDLRIDPLPFLPSLRIHRYN